MSLMKTLFAGTALVALSAGVAAAEPALIFDLGGKFDKSFNEAANNGAVRWAEETGGSYKELEMQSEAQREQALRRLAETGANPIIMTGFAFGDVLNKVAPDYPDTKFGIIDMVVEQPNVQSVVFTEEQGSYLAGIMAAMASETDTVGFIGGMDIPLIHKFECGFAQGFKSVKPEGNVLINYTGTTPAAWNDPVKGGELAKAQISQGADVVYAAAGGTGIGVLQAVADGGKLGVGVDSNQNHLHPGSMLTSMVKRVDNAVFDAFTAGADLEAGVKVMDLKADGVAVAIDDDNKDLVTAEMQTAIDEATAQIADGSVAVHDYMTDNTCPVQ
ncbi:BMP family lipoprotein [Paracoccus tegillarcae]|uniref:BMP family ABC transporter substrate-binding protein n=1 Tax=Paracoccus tegillarcae TaxID=1529068 RepID=A0A2K9EZX5_9RHOB|nr:BMP family ABC transporter substrate-binding protein [Paracoccus tegillarcae]AUH32441.1 BMP family ABC transporter substrate-binding protein [Paracoccus tegillarcae]